MPGAFWGRSIPDLAATSQKMCNGIACALADNLSMASGPMVWVHADRFADGEDTQSIYPWRLWQLKSDPSQGVNPGIGFFQADDRAASLMSTYEQWETRADDATGIPRYTYGNDASGGAGETASGLSMLMNNAAKGLRRAIGNHFGKHLGPRVELVAHKLVEGQRIAIHNDFLVGGETHRLTVQLNRGLDDEDGGFFMLFNSFDAADVHRVLRPVSGTGIGFEIGPHSHHAVSRMHGGERYTLVYSFHATDVP